MITIKYHNGQTASNGEQDVLFLFLKDTLGFPTAGSLFKTFYGFRLQIILLMMNKVSIITSVIILFELEYKKNVCRNGLAAAALFILLPLLKYDISLIFNTFTNDDYRFNFHFVQMVFEGDIFQILCNVLFPLFLFYPNLVIIINKINLPYFRYLGMGDYPLCLLGFTSTIIGLVAFAFR